MKDIFNIYEGLLDDDEKVETGAKKSTLTNEFIKKYFKEHPVQGIESRWGNCNMFLMDDNGKQILYLDVNNGEEVVFTSDLPDFMKIDKIESKRGKGDCTIVIENGVTTLSFLPNVMDCRLVINSCNTLKDFGDVKQVKALTVKNSNLQSLKGLPKATSFIRFINSGEWDEKQLSKFSGIPKSKITVFK